MNGEEVLKLIDAGFTADEVRKMQTETAEPPATSEPQGSETKTSEVKPETEEQKDINTDFMDSITKAVSDLTDKVKAIQEHNVKSAVTPERKELSTDEVIKSFIESM